MQGSPPDAAHPSSANKNSKGSSGSKLIPVKDPDYPQKPINTYDYGDCGIFLADDQHLENSFCPMPTNPGHSGLPPPSHGHSHMYHNEMPQNAHQQHPHAPHNPMFPAFQGVADSPANSGVVDGRMDLPDYGHRAPNPFFLGGMGSYGYP